MLSLSKLKLSIFGESHGAMIGMVLEGIPAGAAIDMSQIQNFVDRRKSSSDGFSTPRKEADKVDIVSGVSKGYATGMPIMAVICNNNIKSSDYCKFSEVPRPSHADYVASVKYNGYAQIAGGGHFSGRLTAPLCIAGAIASSILAKKGVQVAAYVSDLGGIHAVSYKDMQLSASVIAEKRTAMLHTLSGDKEPIILEKITEAINNGDSLGGAVECVVSGLPVGLGAPHFDGLEGALALALFGIPAVKSVEFGAGCDFISMLGSVANDQFMVQNGAIRTKTNHSGGINGGISNGMDVTMRVGIRPTPSISKPQTSVNLVTCKEEILIAAGRHDVCIVPRAVAAVEGAVALVILNALLDN